MVNPKNFQKYRLEVTKLSVHFDFADDISTFARSDTGKGSPRSQEGELGKTMNKFIRSVQMSVLLCLRYLCGLISRSFPSLLQCGSETSCFGTSLTALQAAASVPRSLLRPRTR